MKKNSCRVCHVMHPITEQGFIRTHTNKYTLQKCRGSGRPPVNRLKHTDQPKDYPVIHEQSIACDFSGMVAIYLGGVVTGGLMGWILF